jgi:hypothetical protein
MLKPTTKYIVEVSLRDSIDRVRKSKIVGVWARMEDVPLDKIRRLNEMAHPDKKIEIHARAYFDI